MASANRSAFMMLTMRTALATISGVTVSKVFYDGMKTIADTLAYPSILNQKTEGFLEDGGGDSIGTATFSVIFHKALSKDTANEGTAFDAYAELVESVEDALADAQTAATAGQTQETHTDNRFKTHISNIVITGWDGFFDSKPDLLATACFVDVHYRHIAL